MRTLIKKEGVIMKMVQLCLLTMLLFISGCSSSDNSFEEQKQDWPELAVVEAEIGSDWDNISIENDQGNSRVLLYEEAGEMMYKSVYVLSEQRLKIIQINDDEEGLLYNEIIEE